MGDRIQIETDPARIALCEATAALRNVLLALADKPEPKGTNDRNHRRRIEVYASWLRQVMLDALEGPVHGRLWE